MAAVVELLRGQPVVLLFLILGFGYLIGRVRIADIQLGAVAGTLLVGVFFGHYGVRITPGAQAVGFALFMFSVGYQAGPRFLEVMRAQGLRYFGLALFIGALALVTAALAGRLLRLGPGGIAGLLSGALTSGSALAAAQEAMRSGLVHLPAGWTAARAISAASTSYAITFIVGTIATVLGMGFLPKLLGLDPAAAAREVERSSQGEVPEPLQARAYRVENPQFCQVPITELARRYWDGLAVVRVRRGLEWLKAAPGEHLRIGDEVYAYGYANFFRTGIDRAGPEIRILQDLEFSATQRHVVIARAGAVGQSLEALDLARRYGLVVLGARRDGYLVPVTPQLVLQLGDVLTVMGPVWGIKALPDTLGPVEPDAIETDMTTFVFGIALGAAVGLVGVTLRGIPLTLGLAGGLLAVGILVGWFNSVRPTVGRFPEAARWILMEFGMAVFVAGVGLSAGENFLTALRESGATLIAATLVIITVCMGGGYLFGRKVLKLEPLTLLGAITGAMTCTPALRLLTSESRSTVPALGYTGTYAMASIFMTLAGTLGAGL
ncbi:MAG TPA: TrkA C-terminal domain-containing protein [Steroidobacteraceae bacterium]|jgi:putative transport protein